MVWEQSKMVAVWFSVSMIWERTFLALLRFYEHNGPVVFLILVILVSLLFLVIKPRRRFVFLLLGSLLLLLEFEYTKVIFKEVKNDWLNQVFSPDFRFRKYHFSLFFFQDVVPFLMSLLGWGFLLLAALI